MSNILFGNDFVYWAIIHCFGKMLHTAMGLVPKGYALTPEYAAMVSNVQMSSLPVSRRIDGWNFETYTCDKEFRASVTPASPYPLVQNRNTGAGHYGGGRPDLAPRQCACPG